MAIKPPNNTSPFSGYWDVPQFIVGGQRFPRLILGDHGFLVRYGSKLEPHEVIERIRFALSLASCGIAAGDESCLRAARISFEQNVNETALVYHTDIALVLDAAPVEFERCMSSLIVLLEREVSGFLERDPIIGSFLRPFRPYIPYTAVDAVTLDINRPLWEEEKSRIRHFHPKLITVGGDYLDFALAVGRYDVALTAIRAYRFLSTELEIPLAIALYTGPLTISAKTATFPNDVFDAVMIPLNLAGLGMVPDRDSLLSWARKFKKPLIAMHPLGSGSININDALTFVFSEENASIAIAGASTYEHIHELILASRTVLEK